MSDSIKILFLADLHYTKDNILNNKKYISDFCESVNDLHETEPIDIMVVAGDICDRGGSEECYEEVVKIINTIIKEIKVEKIIIVPGNHDVSRDALMGVKGEKRSDTKKIWEYSEKYKYFKQIENVENISIDMEKIIVSRELIKDKYLFLGINSNYKIGIEDGIGFVNIQALRSELEAIKNSQSEAYDDLLKIVIMHHCPQHYNSHLENPSNNNNLSTNTIGNFDLNNWEQLKEVFNLYGISIVLTGHNHGSQINIISEANEGEKEIYYSTIGSLGMDFNRELKGILGFVHSQNMSEADKQKYSELSQWLEEHNVNLSISNHHNTYGIIEIKHKKLEEQHYKYVSDEGVAKWIPWYKKPKVKVLYGSHDTVKSPFEDEKISVIEKKDENLDKSIMDIIRKEHLYKTGHFHWKEQRAMNWIDTSVLLTNSNYLNLLSNYILNKYSNVLNEAEYIIGLGIKGAIIMSSIRYKYPHKQYSYYPENDENYNEYEKCILNSSNMNKIVVLTDVIHSGETISDFVEKNQKCIADNSAVNAIALFFTGESEELEPIIKDGDKQQVIEISINYLMKIVVKDCGKKGGNCNIVKEKLDVVYEM